MVAHYLMSLGWATKGKQAGPLKLWTKINLFFFSLLWPSVSSQQKEKELVPPRSWAVAGINPDFVVHRLWNQFASGILRLLKLWDRKARACDGQRSSHFTGIWKRIMPPGICTAEAWLLRLQMGRKESSVAGCEPILVVFWKKNLALFCTFVENLEEPGFKRNTLISSVKEI